MAILARDDQGWQSHRRHFAIIDAQAKCHAIIRCGKDLDQWIRFFFAIFEIFLMRYYHSLFAIFNFFDNFLRLEKIAQTRYTEFLNNTKLQNNKSNKEISLIHSFCI